MRRIAGGIIAAALTVSTTAACTSDQEVGDESTVQSQAETAAGAEEAQAEDAAVSFRRTVVARFDEPWALAFLPGTPYLAVTQRGGALKLRNQSTGRVITVSGTPRVVHAGQGGLGDLIPAAGYNGSSRRDVYLSWAEAGSGGSGAVVGRATLVISGNSARLSGLRVIWRQAPKTSGSGHFSHRLAISPDRKHLFVTSGDRQKMTPAQDLSVTLGKVVRLTLDGKPAPGNPFAGRPGAANQIWSYGHRNPLGLAFDGAGRLWSSEMGPRGGDELNVIQRGGNYGWPRASNGTHYDGRDIPDHRSGDGFVAPRTSWNPSISPGSLMIYSGRMFPSWRGDAFIGALSGEALIRVDLNGTTARKAQRWNLGQRIREVEQAPDGSIWLAQDDGALVRLRAT